VHADQRRENIMMGLVLWVLNRKILLSPSLLTFFTAVIVGFPFSFHDVTLSLSNILLYHSLDDLLNHIFFPFIFLIWFLAQVV